LNARLDQQKSTFKSVLVILIAIWVGFTLFTLLTQISGMLTVRGYEPDFLGSLLYGTVKVWLPWALISPLLVFLARRYPVQPDNWIRRVLLHMFFLLVLSLVVGLALSFNYHFREEMNEAMRTYLPWQHIGHFLFGDSFFLYHSIIYTVFIASFNIQNFYRLAEARELDSVRLRNQLNEARLRALRMQINPHFLFNTLNAINVLVMKRDDVKASEMINLLGDYFRTTLNDGEEQWVPLSKELENTEKYLAIEKVRFGQRLSLQRTYDESALSVLVPTMILQPLVENAIQHGVADSLTDCRIRIEATVVDDRLRLSIEDNGVGCGFEAEPGYIEGIGIRNVRDRLSQSYPDDYSFHLTGKVGEGVLVRIDIPARTEVLGN
jgi:sensor histidine kinase YesM